MSVSQMISALFIPRLWQRFEADRRLSLYSNSNHRYASCLGTSCDPSLCAFRSQNSLPSGGRCVDLCGGHIILSYPHCLGFDSWWIVGKPVCTRRGSCILRLIIINQPHTRIHRYSYLCLFVTYTLWFCPSWLEQLIITGVLLRTVFTSVRWFSKRVTSRVRYGLGWIVPEKRIHPRRAEMAETSMG